MSSIEARRVKVYRVHTRGEMKFKPLMTWNEKKLRLFRIIWERGEVGDGKGFSACFSVALVGKLFKFDMTVYDQVRLVIFGLSLHYMRSYGGRFT